MIKILVAHSGYYQSLGLVHRLGLVEGFCVEAYTSLGEELPSLVREHSGQILILSPSLILHHEERFFDMFAQAGLKVILMGRSSLGLCYSPLVKKYGVWDVVDDNIPPEELLGRIVAAAASPQQEATERKTDSGGSPRLSLREYQVLAGILEGRKLKDVAGELGLSQKTVATYKCRLFQKLDVKTTAELIRSFGPVPLDKFFK